MEYNFRGKNINSEILGYKFKILLTSRMYFALWLFFFFFFKLNFTHLLSKKGTINHSELDHVNQHIINIVFFFLKDSQFIYDYLLVFLKMSLGHIKIT